MKTRAILLISLIALLAIGAAGYLGFAGSAQKPQTPPPPQTVPVTRCDVQQTVEAPGTLSNTSETQILMPANGILSQVQVKPGDHVSTGQTLAWLDDQSKAEAQIALKEAQDAYQKAYNYRLSLNGEQWFETASLQYIRGHLVPIVKWQKGYADAKTIQDADNDLALKKALLDEAQATLDRMELKAPFDGVVVEVDAVASQVYQANAVLFKIIDPGALEVDANVTQEDYPLLQTGQAAVVYFDARPDVTVQGHVDRIVPLLVPGTSPTYDIYISLDQVPDGLVDGMTVDTNVTIASRKGVLCLPRNVVHASGNNTSVLQVWNGLTTGNRQVTTGLRGDTNIEILSGLQLGEQVVVR